MVVYVERWFVSLEDFCGRFWCFGFFIILFCVCYMVWMCRFEVIDGGIREIIK